MSYLAMNAFTKSESTITVTPSFGFGGVLPDLSSSDIVKLA
jgi:hypothetical protein